MIKFIKTHIPEIILPVIFTALACYCSIHLLYNAYQSFAFDLGIFIQNFQNGGLFYSRLQDCSQFAIHFSPILYIVLPIFKLFPYVQTLLVVQALALAVAGYLVYYLARWYKLNRSTSLLMQFLFYINPLVWGMVLFDWHEVCFAPACILIMIIGILQKRKLVFAIGLFLSLMIKEDVVLTIGVLGLIMLISSYFRDRQINKQTLTMIASCIAIAIITIVVSRATSRVSQTSSGLLDLLIYRFSGGNPSSMIGNFFSIESVVLIYSYLIPLAFLPLISIFWAIPGLCILALCMLSSFYGQHTQIWQYGSAAIAYFFTATIITVTKPRVFKYINILAIVMCLLSLVILFSPITRARNMTAPNETTKAIDQIIAQVPDKASVTANNELFDHLVLRCDTYIPKNGFEGNGSRYWGYPDRLTEYVIVTGKHRLQLDWESSIKDTITDQYYLISEIDGNKLYKLK
jgi:uncharacterized membrane protein